MTDCDDETITTSKSIKSNGCYGQIVTEYWIEPQVGNIKCPSNGTSYMEGLDFKSVSNAVSKCYFNYFISLPVKKTIEWQGTCYTYSFVYVVVTYVIFTTL